MSALRDFVADLMEQQGGAVDARPFCRACHPTACPRCGKAVGAERLN